MKFVKLAAVPAFALAGTVTTVSADQLTSDEVSKTLDQIFTDVTSDVLKSQAKDSKELLLETATNIVNRIDKLNVSDSDKELLKEKAKDFISEVAVKATESKDDSTRCGCPQHQLLYALVDKLDELAKSSQESKLETPKTQANTEKVETTKEPVTDAKNTEKIEASKEPVADVKATEKVETTKEPVSDANNTEKVETSKETVTQPTTESPLEEAKEKQTSSEPKEVQDLVDKVTDVKDVEKVKSDDITSDAGRGKVESKAQETKTSKQVYIKKSEYRGDQKGTGVVYYDDPKAINGDYVTLSEDEAKTKGYSPSLRRSQKTVESSVKPAQPVQEQPKVAQATTNPLPTVKTETEQKQDKPAPTQPQSPRKAQITEPTPVKTTQTQPQAQTQLPQTGDKDSTILSLFGVLSLIPVTLTIKRKLT